MSKEELRYAAAACQVDFPNPADRAGIKPHTDRMIDMIDPALERRCLRRPVERSREDGPAPFEHGTRQPLPDEPSASGDQRSDAGEVLVRRGHRMLRSG